MIGTAGLKAEVSQLEPHKAPQANLECYCSHFEERKEKIPMCSTI